MINDCPVDTFLIVTIFDKLTCFSPGVSVIRSFRKSFARIRILCLARFPGLGSDFLAMEREIARKEGKSRGILGAIISLLYFPSPIALGHGYLGYLANSIPSHSY